MIAVEFRCNGGRGWTRYDAFRSTGRAVACSMKLIALGFETRMVALGQPAVAA